MRNNAAEPLRLIYANRVQAAASDRYNRRDWHYWCFEYILAGQGELQVGQQQCSPRAGDLYVLPAGRPHCYWADPVQPWDKLYFNVQGRLVEALLAAYGLEDMIYVPQCRQHAAFQQMINLWQQSRPDLHQQAALVFHRLLNGISHQTYQRENRYSAAVQQALDFIEQSLERPVNMAAIAAAAERSPAHLSRRFRREVGLTPYDYLIQRRLERARQLLESTTLSVKEIAAMLQYADACYFSNTFKLAVGVAPSMYRQRFW